MSDYTPPVNGAGYLNSGNWGTGSTVKSAATSIEHIAEKAEFGLQMLDALIRSGDALEKEIVMMSNSNEPPRREWMLSLATRMDAQQTQMREAVSRIREFQHDIKHVAKPMQNRSW